MKKILIMMTKWCHFLCTTIADPILESYRIMPSHRLWRLWSPHFRFGNSHPADTALTCLSSGLQYEQDGIRRLNYKNYAVVTAKWTNLCSATTYANKRALPSFTPPASLHRPVHRYLRRPVHSSKVCDRRTDRQTNARTLLCILCG